MDLKFRTLTPEEIDVRIAKINERGAMLLLYKDARVDQNLLDETVGPENWQRSHELINGNLFCNVGIYINRGSYGEWVWKQDVGTESYTEKEKGQASDSFKRACFNWGIGRELYTAPFVWISAEDMNLKGEKGKFACYDEFRVAHIAYKDGAIVDLEIKNMAAPFNGDVVWSMSGKKGKKKSGDSKKKESKPEESRPEEKKPESVKDVDVKVQMMKYFKSKGFDEEKKAKVAAIYKVKSVEDMSGDQCRNYLMRAEQNSKEKGEDK